MTRIALQGFRAWRALVALVLALAGAGAAAHEMSIAEMELREIGRGEFLWQWTAAQRGGGDGLVPRWPAPCRAEGSLLRCGDGGLRGTLAVDGVGERYSAAIVKVIWADGTTRAYTITQAQPEARLWGAADDPRGAWEVGGAYLVLGVEHILGGIDHLLFVLGLLFLVGFERRLVWTISAFTLAHSVTLALASLQILTLRPAPVEAGIALSIVLVASEALNRQPTLGRRWPALVAFGFGLVHGLGFAGALAQVGLPQNHLAAALLAFNVGVELGQLGVVALAWALWRLAAHWPQAARARTPALYAIGGVAAFWFLQRAVALVA